MNQTFQADNENIAWLMAQDHASNNQLETITLIRISAIKDVNLGWQKEYEFSFE